MERGTRATTVAASVYAALWCGPITAAPLPMIGVPGVVRPEPTLHLAGTFCFNRRSGRFINWGRCRPSVPRVYCQRGGRFLHWGSCYY